MDQILDAPLSEERNFNYAGFWIRAAAYLIDLITIWLIIMILIFTIGSGIFLAGGNTSLIIVFFLIMFASVVGYFSIMESSSWQATLGKRAVGIKVGDVNGNRISFANALGRFFAKYLSGFFFGIGYMMAGWDRKKQALHDRACEYVCLLRVVYLISNSSLLNLAIHTTNDQVRVSLFRPERLSTTEGVRS